MKPSLGKNREVTMRRLMGGAAKRRGRRGLGVVGSRDFSFLSEFAFMRDPDREREGFS